MSGTGTDGHTRRNLIVGLGVGAVGAAASASQVLKLSLAPSGAKPAASWWDRMFLSLKNGSNQEWASVIGQVFTIEGESGKVPVLLGGVNLLPSKGARPRECTRSQAFALVFQAAPERAPAGDRTYKVTHPTFPALDIYLSAPIRLRRGVHFQAVFN